MGIFLVYNNSKVNNLYLLTPFGNTVYHYGAFWKKTFVDAHVNCFNIILGGVSSVFIWHKPFQDTDIASIYLGSTPLQVRHIFFKSVLADRSSTLSVRLILHGERIDMYPTSHSLSDRCSYLKEIYRDCQGNYNCYKANYINSCISTCFLSKDVLYHHYLNLHDSCITVLSYLHWITQNASLTVVSPVDSVNVHGSLKNVLDLITSYNERSSCLGSC